MTDGVGRIFVYGTLLSALAGRGHRSLPSWTRLVGTGTVAGTLYDTGDYPAALLGRGGEERIRGELHLVPRDREAELLRGLDAYEGYDPARPDRSLFVRLLVEVELDAGGTATAWIYRYNREVSGLTPIPSGDYLAFLDTSLSNPKSQR
jgi:gamma-glutamylcyclotransferase (GGCT)/AIG2-like uncharacterized protein YtfP